MKTLLLFTLVAWTMIGITGCSTSESDTQIARQNSNESDANSQQEPVDPSVDANQKSNTNQQSDNETKSAASNTQEPASQTQRKVPVPRVDVREPGPPEIASSDSDLNQSDNDLVPDSEWVDPDVPTIEELEALQEKLEEEFHNEAILVGENWKPFFQVDETKLTKEQRLKQSHIWLDQQNKKVMVRGMICLRQGGLEMFACPRGTKEHESIISVHALSSEIHTLFLALGFDPGKPVQLAGEYYPADDGPPVVKDYRAAFGPKIKIDIMWMGEDGKMKSRPAQDFVRNAETQEQLKEDWVFSGSFSVKDEYGEAYYGDAGEMICLSNFPAAMMDVPIQSSDDAEMGLLFEAFTDNIPPVNTKVYLVMTPSKAEKDPATKTPPEKETTETNDKSADQ